MRAWCVEAEGRLRGTRTAVGLYSVGRDWAGEEAFPGKEGMVLHSEDQGGFGCRKRGTKAGLQLLFQ